MCSKSAVINREDGCLLWMAIHSSLYLHYFFGNLILLIYVFSHQSMILLWDAWMMNKVCEIYIIVANRLFSKIFSSLKLLICKQL